MNTGSQNDVAAIGFNLTTENLHQSCFASSIATQQTDPLARFNLAVNGIE